MKIIEWFLGLFRKKEYYQVDYEELIKGSSLEFREVYDDTILEIKKIILDFNNVDVIETEKNDLFENDAEVFFTIDELVEKVINIINQDFRETYFEAQKERWEFNYLLTSNNIYENTLLIANRLSYQDEETGDLIYSILAIKKYKGIFYLWDFL